MQDNILILAILLLSLPLWFIGALILKILIHIKGLPTIPQAGVAKKMPQKKQNRTKKVPYLGNDGLYDYRNEGQTKESYEDTVEYITERIKEELMNG